MKTQSHWTFHFSGKHPDFSEDFRTFVSEIRKKFIFCSKNSLKILVKVHWTSLREIYKEEIKNIRMLARQERISVQRAHLRMFIP